MNLQLDNKLALVSGSTAGIGLAIATPTSRAPSPPPPPALLSASKAVS